MNDFDPRPPRTADEPVARPAEPYAQPPTRTRRPFRAIVIALIAIAIIGLPVLFLRPPRTFMTNAGHIRVTAEVPGKLFIDGTPVTLPPDSIITVDNGERSLKFVANDPRHSQDTTVVVDNQSRENPIPVTFKRKS